MRFLVCIKQVVDSSKMVVDPDTGRLNRNNANSILNPCDRNALEAALALKEQHGGTVTAITMGPPQEEAVLREAASMGVDDLYLLTDRAFGGADTLATSYALVGAIQKIGPFDLIFTGQESIDSNTAQVGPEIASMLGIPDVSGAIGKLSLEGDHVTVERHMGHGAEVVEMKLPALITAAPELNTPRYPSIKGILEKDDREIHIITSKDLDIDTSRIGIKGSPTQVKRVRPIVPGKKENLKIENENVEEAARELAEAFKKIRII